MSSKDGNVEEDSIRIPVSEASLSLDQRLLQVKLGGRSCLYELVSLANSKHGRPLDMPALPLKSISQGGLRG